MIDLSEEELLEALFAAVGAALSYIEPCGLNKGIMIPDPRENGRLVFIYTDEVGTHLLEGEEFDQFVNEFFPGREFSPFEILDRTEEELDDETLEDEPERVVH